MWGKWRQLNSQISPKSLTEVTKCGCKQVTKAKAMARHIFPPQLSGSQRPRLWQGENDAVGYRVTAEGSSSICALFWVPCALMPGRGRRFCTQAVRKHWPSRAMGSPLQPLGSATVIPDSQGSVRASRWGGGDHTGRAVRVQQAALKPRLANMEKL